MIKRLLIANRGEIACRVITTAKAMGITTIAVYSDADAQARHVRLADQAFSLGGSSAQDSYLNFEKIIQISKDHHVDAIHPGYGFLSENTAFAKACSENNIIFVGPSIESIELMGSKKDAKDKMIAMGIPTVPGFNITPSSTHDEIETQCLNIGYPILIKAAAGGGGKGMRIVESQSELEQAIAEAKGEALNSFNDDTLIIEKFLRAPRHIECQVFADTHGNAVHLYERDCSIQRRYQKIIEEAPATGLSQSFKNTIYDLAIKITQGINYVGAGTIEFLVEDEQVFFMEMNTRLQVEHPVTEMITDLDLVEWQIRVAQGESLPLKQEHIQCHGHAIEVRIYAEDPYKNFKPQVGHIKHLKWPKAIQGLRIDHGLQSADTISPYYDPMIAKMIVHRSSRESAIHGLDHALRHLLISGVKTNQTYLSTILSLPSFTKGGYSTHFIKEHKHQLTFSVPNEAKVAAGLYLFLTHDTGLQHFRLNQNKKTVFTLNTEQELHTISVEKTSSGFLVTLNEQESQLIDSAMLHDNQLRFLYDGQHSQAMVREDRAHKTLTVFSAHSPCTFQLIQDSTEHHQDDAGEQHSLCPMPGTVAAILVEPDAVVNKGEGIIVIEAMKMQHTLTAPTRGRVKDIFYAHGDQVAEGVALYDFNPEEE